MARVLVVEDDPQQREMRVLLLREEGHTLRAAGTAVQALAALIRFRADVVILDLRIPTVEEGCALIRELRLRLPRARLIVLTGLTGSLAARPERKLVDRVLQKPVRSELLLSLLKSAVLLVMLAAPALPAGQTFAFHAAEAREFAATVEVSAPAYATAELRLDGRFHSHLAASASLGTLPYAIHLGRLAPGRHELAVAGGLHVERFELHPEGTPDEQMVLAHAPILFTRPNVLGRFSDVPLIAYCERLEGGLLQYTVIFSNEDGGTSTRALMARWGRTTDIEHVYRVWLDSSGRPRRASIQTKDHKDVDFTGPREGLHPLLHVSTENNMVAPGEAPALRYRLAPILADLTGGSRELVMDRHPWTYRAAAAELLLENKIRPFGARDGQKISDPRNYLYLEASIANRDSRAAFRIRPANQDRWYSSHLGKLDYAIERSGWVRTSVELGENPSDSAIAEIAFECLVDKNAKLGGECVLERVSKAFFLDADYRPRPAFWSFHPARPVRLSSGEMVRWNLQSK